MALQFTALLLMIVLTNARVVPSGDIFYSDLSAVHAQPQKYRVLGSHHALGREADDFDPHPQYRFGYNVQDTFSGDAKSQVESRDGDFVQGEYSLIDADGYKRTVQYTADAAHGFNAVVSREPSSKALKSIATPVATRTIIPEKVIDSPVFYTARATERAYDSDPVVKGAYAVTPIVRATPVAYP